MERLFSCAEKASNNSDDYDQSNEQEDAPCDSLINKIPNEICLHIFGYLSPRDLCKISLVCRSFKKLAGDDQIWKSKCPRSIISSISKQYKQIYIEWRKELTHQQHLSDQRRRDHAITTFREYRPYQTQECDCMIMPRILYHSSSSHFCHNGCMNHLSGCFYNSWGDTGCDSCDRWDDTRCDFSDRWDGTICNFSNRWPSTRCFSPTGGFIKHPSSSQDLTITLSVDLDETIPALYTLLTKASPFKQQYQQSAVLKQMIQRYDRFMQLKASQPADTLLIPTLDIEIIWQTHLLRPEIYRDDCERLFGHIIDHSIVIKNNIEQFHKQQAFINTCQLYEQKFGEKYCSLPSIDQYNDVTSNYPYWDETFFEFSLNSPKNYQNRFSFTRNDIIHDLNWFDLWGKTKRYDASEYTSTDIDQRRKALQIPKKIYEEFLFLATKYKIKPGIDFVPRPYEIDLIWHSHMQEPLNYENDCNQFVGYVLHHNPSPGIDEEAMQQICYIVDEMWEDEF